MQSQRPINIFHRKQSSDQHIPLVSVKPVRNITLHCMFQKNKAILFKMCCIQSMTFTHYIMLLYLLYTPGWKQRACRFTEIPRVPEKPSHSWLFYFPYRQCGHHLSMATDEWGWKESKYLSHRELKINSIWLSLFPRSYFLEPFTYISTWSIKRAAGSLRA